MQARNDRLDVAMVALVHPGLDLADEPRADEHRAFWPDRDGAGVREPAGPQLDRKAGRQLDLAHWDVVGALRYQRGQVWRQRGIAQFRWTAIGRRRGRLAICRACGQKKAGHDNCPAGKISMQHDLCFLLGCGSESAEAGTLSTTPRAGGAMNSGPTGSFTCNARMASIARIAEASSDHPSASSTAPSCPGLRAPHNAMVLP